MASKKTDLLNDPSNAETVSTAVLEGCRIGDESAQRRLYELCHRQVHRLMIQMVGLQDAADLTQQVFLQAFRTINQFAGNSKFETWLYRLSVNEALQQIRKAKIRKTQPLSHEPTCHDKMGTERYEHKELLEHALSRIEPELRSLFALREIEGLSYREISKVVEIPEGTVGSKLNRARRALQQQLIALGWDP